MTRFKPRLKRNPAILRVNYSGIGRSRGFLQFILQCPDMPRRIVYFVTRLYGYVAVIRKTIELLDYFFTSIVHVRSLRTGFGNKDRIRPLAGRYGLFHRHNCYLSEFGDQVTIGDDKNIKYINIISIRSGVQLSLDPNRLIVLLSTHRSKFMSELIGRQVITQ